MSVFNKSCPGGSALIFFFIDAATTEIYTLSLHDALPISSACPWRLSGSLRFLDRIFSPRSMPERDRKSTRLNSSHLGISYADYSLKKNKDPHKTPIPQTKRTKTKLKSTRSPHT